MGTVDLFRVCSISGNSFAVRYSSLAESFYIDLIARRKSRKWP